MRNRIVLSFDTEDACVLNHIVQILNTVVPYMADNVTILVSIPESESN